MDQRSISNSDSIYSSACSSVIFVDQSMSNSDSSASSSSPSVILKDQSTSDSDSSSVILMDQSIRNSDKLDSFVGPSDILMDPHLLKACTKGDLSLYSHLMLTNPDTLLSITPHSNNCLHIAAMLGHDEFAKEVWSRAPFLFSGINDDGETPLTAALMAANASLASDIITAASWYMEQDNFKHMLLKVDRRGENALHHAMRNGFQNLALELLKIEPQMSEQVIKTGESAMYMAARRGYSKIVERLLQIPSSADSGPEKESALHAAVRFGNAGIVKQLLEGRRKLAYCKDSEGDNPMERAINHNNLELVKIFLEYDPNLAYIKNAKTKTTPFITAAQIGFVPIAEEIMRVCPDSVYAPNIDGYSALHEAIGNEKSDFINFILRTPQLHRFINQATDSGSLPLHHAARMCNPKILRSLLSHVGQDHTAVNANRSNAVNAVYAQTDLLKTLKWNESFTLLSNVIPSGWKHLIKEDTILMMKEEAIKEVKSLTTKYISNTSLVAALLATITFAAAFTLPGGFNSDPAEAGLPIFARKAAFQVFLVSDTVAMCSSLSVAFLCILTTWEDLDFLLNYRKTTRVLMWCAYEATALAFGTGLFTVIAPNNLYLAILILVVCTILPFLSKIIGDWPILMVRYRLRGHFRKDLVPNI